jgi:type IV secretion system protein VirB5
VIKHLTKLALVLCVWAAPHTARAGIPVIDVASLAQAIADAATMIEQLAQLEAQLSTLKDTYTQAQRQVEAIKGARGLGGVLNSPALQNYVPKNARTILDAVQSGGYGGLSGSAKALRDVGRVYNCEGIDDSTQRQACEAELNKPYQYLAYVQDALQAGANRTDQINALMDQAGSTGDAKEIAEIQARIGAENALLQHELTQATLMRNMAQAEAQAAEARARELQRARAARNGKMGGIAGGAP